MSARARIFAWLYGIATLGTLAWACWLAVNYAPIEREMGVVQKILYLHLPVAMNTFLAGFVACVAGIGYLWSREDRWDDLAQASAKVAVLFCTVVLVTGMIWAHGAWNTWWTWSPRLTLSFILWLFYAAYLIIRPLVDSPSRRAVVSAVYLIIAFLDVPLVYFSVQMIPEDMHPKDIALDPAMRRTLLVWFVPVTMMCVGLIAGRYALEQSRRRAVLGRGEGATGP